MGAKRKPATTEPEKPISVRLPRELRQRLKGYCGRSEQKIQDVVAEILDEGLKKRGA
jgi:hypothetical protein